MTSRALRVWISAVLFAGTGALAATGDDFYDRLFARGITQFGQGNYGGAYASLRVAAFGLLEDVRRFELTEVYMTVAASRLKHEADARYAAQRVVNAERVERHYAALTLPDAVRREFEDVTRKLLGQEDFALLHGTAPRTQPAPQPPAESRTPAPIIVPAPQPPPKPVPVQPQTKPVQTQPQPPRPQPQTAPVTVDPPSFADAERAVNSGDLIRARTLYRAILDAPQLSHVNALRAAEGLYRSRDFGGAIRAFERAGTIGAGEEQYHWYYAVALFENGRARDAKRELRAALPYIDLTPEMERVRARIEAAPE